MIIFKRSELQISRYVQKQDQKETLFFFFFEKREPKSILAWLRTSSMKKCLQLMQNQKNPFHIQKKLHFLFRVAIPFNEITNMELINYIVNSLNISNLSLYKYERKLYVPREDYCHLDLRICRARKSD